MLKNVPRVNEGRGHQIVVPNISESEQGGISLECACSNPCLKLSSIENGDMQD